MYKARRHDDVSCCILGRYIFRLVLVATLQLHIEATPVPISRVDSLELLKTPGPETPGRGRRGSLYRVNSIIDGTEMEVGRCVDVSHLSG